MLTTYQRQAKMKLITTVLTLVVIAGVMVLADHLKAKTAALATITTSTSTPAASTSTTTTAPTTSTTSTSSAASTTSPTTTSSSTSGFKDGTYNASSSYYVPHGNENIQVSLTISNGVVTKASVQNSEGDPTSAQYQESFAAEYKSAVVGKKISGLQLSVIGGASDTTQGFNDALSQISSKAAA